jgi:nucleoid-associated protein YgaU
MGRKILVACVVVLGVVVALHAVGLAGVFAFARMSENNQLPKNTHVVRSGETLVKIAHEHGCTSGEIASLNGISNPDKIQEGQVLAVPARK